MIKIIKFQKQKSTSLIKPPLSQKIKSGLIVLNQGEEIGEHRTENREEIVIIFEGKAIVNIESKKKTVFQNHLIYIPQNKKHNIRNESQEVLKYIYVVCPCFRKIPDRGITAI